MFYDEKKRKDESAQPDDPTRPPAGGRQDHEAMRAAATRKVTGPASTDTLAAGGGLEVPEGGEVDPGRTRREPIPGERERNTLVGTPPAAVSGTGVGLDTPSSDLGRTMDAQTTHDHEVEGGGKGGRKEK